METKYTFKDFAEIISRHYGVDNTFDFENSFFNIWKYRMGSGFMTLSFKNENIPEVNYMVVDNKSKGTVDIFRWGKDGSFGTNWFDHLFLESFFLEIENGI